jgi:hypothetical protein
MVTSKQVESAKKASDKAFVTYTKKRKKYITSLNKLRKEKSKQRKKK